MERMGRGVGVDVADCSGGSSSGTGVHGIQHYIIGPPTAPALGRVLCVGVRVSGARTGYLELPRAMWRSAIRPSEQLRCGTTVAFSASIRDIRRAADTEEAQSEFIPPVGKHFSRFELRHLVIRTEQRGLNA